MPKYNISFVDKESGLGKGNHYDNRAEAFDGLVKNGVSRDLATIIVEEMENNPGVEQEAEIDKWKILATYQKGDNK